MNKKPFAWSHTALSSFETCPHRHYRTRVVRDVEDPPGDAMLWGQRVHAALEKRLADKMPLPETFAAYEPYAARLDRVAGTVHVEQQVAITRNLEPTEWFAGDAWCRGAFDVVVLKGDRVLVLDWKTGRRKHDGEQVRLFAWLAFLRYPDVQRADTGYVWLKEGGAVDRESFRREQMLDLWQHFAPRVTAMEAAYVAGADAHPKKPSGLCRAWCPVKDCQFNGR